MKQLRIRVKAGFAVLLTGFVAFLLAGCETTGPRYNPVPDADGNIPGKTDFFGKGDLVTITFSAPNLTMNPHEERIRDDGTITPPDIGSVKAAGKTAGALQSELQEKYSHLYRNFTVTVKAGDRFYHVDGEVRTPGPKPYLGETDVVKAIAAAGGFTEFARKSKVQLIHPNGKKDTINYEKALEDSTFNLPVYPGDQIYVPRRIL